VLRQQSQKCDSLAEIIKHIRIIYTTGHRVSVDFQSRAVILKEVLPWSLPKEALSWSLTKPQIVTLFYVARFVSVVLKQELQTSGISSRVASVCESTQKS